MSTDRIEKKILLHAPRKRVWRALSDSTEFGTWFGMKFDGPFVPGAVMHGVIVGTKVSTEVAKAQKEYEGLSGDIIIERIERRSKAFTANEQGWTMVLKLIEEYLGQTP